MSRQADSRPVSVVVPVFNRAGIVERSLQSIYNQTYRPIRLIVVDNNSSDATREVVKNWISSHSDDGFSAVLLSERKQGAAAARNRGLEAVSSEWVFFFDSDDVALPEMVASAMEEADSNGDADMVFWRTADVGSDGRLSPRRFARTNLLQRHIYNALLATQAYAVRTDFIRRCGGWNEILPCWDDWELGLRLLCHNPRIRGIDRVLVHIYPQKDSITGTDFHSKAGKWELAISEMESFALSLPFSLRMKVLRMLCYRRVNLAALYAREKHAQLGRRLRDATFVHPLYYSKSVSGPGLNLPDRLLLRAIYHYTRLGGRGAYLLWS